jgi:hypothetical protein
VLLLAAGLLAACGQNSTSTVTPKEIAQDTYCALDGMLLADYPGPKAQIHYAGQPEPEFFCDTTEMFSLLLKPEQARKVSAAYVQDMDKADWAAPEGRLDRRQGRLLRGRLEETRRHGAHHPLLRHPRRCAEVRHGRRGQGPIPTPKSPPTWPASTAAPSTTRECKPMDPFYSNTSPGMTPSRSNSSPA